MMFHLQQQQHVPWYIGSTTPKLNTLGNDRLDQFFIP